jgi:glycosyltransferase involved in cell wall biosynthesis
MKTNTNVLVLVPGKLARGGVTTYYNALRKHLPQNNIFYLERGARKFPYKKNYLNEVLRVLRDYFLFITTLISKRIDIVHTNTSFDRSAVLRDMIFIFIAKLFRKKTIVFYRGWDEDYADKILTLKKSYRKKILLSVDTSIVLAEKFKKDLEEAGYKGRTYVETTTVDTELLDLRHTINNNKEKNEFCILYLARLEKQKGIYIVLEAFKQIKKKHKHVCLKIAGDGQEFENLKTIIKEEDIKDVSLLGFVSGKIKAEILESSSIYVFPTNYKEGMPNSVLEAFAFGLPVITRPVAGLKDVFIDGKTGYLINSLDVEYYVNVILKLIEDKENYNNISNFCIKYSEKFHSSNVAKRLLEIYELTKNPHHNKK